MYSQVYSFICSQYCNKSGAAKKKNINNSFDSTLRGALSGNMFQLTESLHCIGETKKKFNFLSPSLLAISLTTIKFSNGIAFVLSSALSLFYNGIVSLFSCLWASNILLTKKINKIKFKKKTLKQLLRNTLSVNEFEKTNKKNITEQ